MMETLVQPYTPHLKKVLKRYQLSAVKSLQGPSVLLGPGMDVSAVVPKTEPAPESPKVAASGDSPSGDAVESFPPPPFPIQQLPILSEADQRSERGETVLEGEAISCFVVGGERRLCLPQILNSVLRDFTLAQINQVCDELQIFCSRCNPEQLEVLKVTGILPASAPSCGLITKTDAERLCSALLHHGVPSPPDNPAHVSFQVYHECFGKCRGLCIPSLFSTPMARCIECLECHAMFSPQHFVCHAHRALQNRTCHWGFDSNNWRSYLLVVRDQPEYESAVKMLDNFKELDPAAVVVHVNKRKNHDADNDHKSLTTSSSRDSELSISKKQKLDYVTSSTRCDNNKTNNSDVRSHTNDVPGLKSMEDSSVRNVKNIDETTLRKLNDDSLRQLGIRTLDETLGVKTFDDRSLKSLEDPYNAYLQYAAAAAAEPYIYWYDSWRMSAFRPWPSIITKDSKSQPILRDSVAQSVPAYLSRGPPVLLHPERVVPLSESERFERSFQPNVALAPAGHQVRPRGDTSITKVKCEPELPEDDKKSIHPTPSVTQQSAVTQPPPPPPQQTQQQPHQQQQKPGSKLVRRNSYNPEIELSTDTDDSSSETTGDVMREKSVVQEVQEVLDALSDAKEATRAKVVALVQQLAARLDLEEANVIRLQGENSELKNVQREQEDLIASKDLQIAELEQRLRESETVTNKQKPSEGFQDMELDMRTRKASVDNVNNIGSSVTNGSSGASGGGGSPVSVITSSPSIVIKTEPSE